MMDSRFNTLSVVKLKLLKDSGDSASAESKRLKPTFITQASKQPLRVVIENISFAAEVFLAFDAATLQDNEPGGNTFMLQAGRSLTLMLAPEQKICAISLSDNAKVSVAISEALPIDKPA